MAQNIFEEASDNPIPPVDQMSPEQRGLFDLPAQLHAPRRHTSRREHRGPSPARTLLHAGQIPGRGGDGVQGAGGQGHPDLYQP